MLENELRQVENDQAQSDADAATLAQFGMAGEAPAPEKKSGHLDLTEPSLDDIAALRQEAMTQARENQMSTVTPKEFGQLTPTPRTGQAQSIDMLLDVALPVSIELGRTSMSIEDVLNLGPGSVVELDKLAGEPVDLLVNEKLIARGEVVVVDENFGIRITSMVSPQDRLKSLK